MIWSMLRARLDRPIFESRMLEFLHDTFVYGHNSDNIIAFL